MGVERLCTETLALLQNIVVQIGQNRRVEAYAVFHQQYHLHASLADVVVDVHLVFYQLDDRENEVGVAQPAEHVVEDGQVFVLHPSGNAVREGGEHHAGNIGKVGLYHTCHVKGIIVGIAGHTHHQVYTGGG